MHTAEFHICRCCSLQYIIRMYAPVMRSYETRSTRHRSIPRSLQRWVSTKSSISDRWQWRNAMLQTFLSKLLKKQFGWRYARTAAMGKTKTGIFILFFSCGCTRRNLWFHVENSQEFTLRWSIWGVKTRYKKLTPLFWRKVETTFV